MESNNQNQPSYGVIDRYLEDRGKEYFDWQSYEGITHTRYSLHLWEPHITPDDDVLDFGCGGGFLLKLLNAKNKVGVEINPHARENAQKLGIQAYPSIDLVPGKFDKVISCHALEHVPHPREAILGLKEKLRDRNSRMVLLLPIDDWRAPFNRTYNPDDINMHLYTWAPQLLGNLLKSCDLEVIDVRIVEHTWPPYKKLWNISPKLFHLAAYFWSKWTNQRQLLAIAALKSPAN
jgi:SAM-dependent methyltransferase